MHKLLTSLLLTLLFISSLFAGDKTVINGIYLSKYDNKFNIGYSPLNLDNTKYERVYIDGVLDREVGVMHAEKRGFKLKKMYDMTLCHTARVDMVDETRKVLASSMPFVFGDVTQCEDNVSVDTTPPVVTLNGEANVTLVQGATYVELGASAVDDVDGNVTVTISGTVDTSTIGAYILTYTATDSSGNRASVSRRVQVEQRFLPPTMALTEELEGALAQGVVPYGRITLEINATSTVKLTALNQTLAEEQNRSIELKGVENNGTFYLYNIPLVKGANTIRLQATNRAGETTQKTIAINADANQTLPLAMRATVYEGVQSLDTTVEVGTDLNVTEYLFDVEGDGKIDTIRVDANFTLHLTDEGRYRPRVTVRTAEGLLFSSDAYALSLDVKATADQKDPVGAEPIDIAKAFVQALIEDDRQKIESLVGYGGSLLHYIYSDDDLRLKAIERANHIDESSWSQIYSDNGSITVTVYADDSTIGRFPITFIIMYYISDLPYSGRKLYIDNLY